MSPKCEPGLEHRQKHGDGDLACTGLALLCFVGAGHAHTHINPYQKHVDAGLNWLVSQQQSDGHFAAASGNYSLAIASLALVETLAWSGDTALLEPTQRAINCLCKRQTRWGGWDYANAASPRLDASVSAWAGMAIALADNIGLSVGASIQGLDTFLAEGQVAAGQSSPFPYWRDAVSGTLSPAIAEPGEIGLSALFVRRFPLDPLCLSLREVITTRGFPPSWPCNLWSLYHDTTFLFQYGGETWSIWTRRIIRELVDRQCQQAHGACFAGSWDWHGAFKGHGTGRLLSTALGCLSLQTFYRYKKIGGL